MFTGDLQCFICKLPVLSFASFKLGIIPYCSIRKKYHNMHMNSIIYIANIYASLLSYFPVKYLFDFQTS